MLRGVPRANKNSPPPPHGGDASAPPSSSSTTRQHQCYRRSPVIPVSSSPQHRVSPSIQARRKRDGKPVYLGPAAASRFSHAGRVVVVGTPPLRPGQIRGPANGLTTTTTVHRQQQQQHQIPPMMMMLQHPPPGREAAYGWCKSLAMLVFGIIILFVVFAAVIAIFPIDKHTTTTNVHHGATAKNRERVLAPFPDQSKDGSCPPGFRPYSSGCILNMPYPRAVDDTIKDPRASPCRSLNAYACGGWRKYDRNRGSRSFRSAGRWNERLAEYVRKVSGLRESFSWDGDGGTMAKEAEHEEVFFHLLTKSCVRSLLPATTTPEASHALRSLLDGLESAGSTLGDRRAVGVMAGMLSARGIPSVIHVEPVRNPTDRSRVAMYMEPWATIGSDPHYVREILRGDDDERLRAHMALVERSCAALASMGRIEEEQVGECAKAALSIEAALIGSVQRIPSAAAAAAALHRIGKDLIPNGEQSMAQAVDANEYRSGFADGFYDALTEDTELSEAEGEAVRRASIWTLGGLEPFFETGLGALLDTEEPSTWRYYFQVIAVSEASHYIVLSGGANAALRGARIKTLMAVNGMDRHGYSAGTSETLVRDYLMPWGRLRRMEPLRGHVTDHAKDFSAHSRNNGGGGGGMIVPYETTRDPLIEESEVWKSCLNVAAAYLPEIADDTFSDLVVSDRDRRLVEEIAGNVLRSLVDSVSASHRLSVEAKRRISSKGRSIIRRVARPWRERPPRHTGLRLLGKNFFDDAMAIRTWNTREAFRAVLFAAGGGKPMEFQSAAANDGTAHQRHHTAAKKETSPFEDPRFARGDTRRFEMPAKTPNAFFDPTQNTITILPGLMRPPFFDGRYSNASLYATIGAVIGHELCHAFDSHGIHYDHHGNLADWMPEGDREAYEEATQCYVRQYDGRKTANGNADDGSLTVNENCADSMGLRAAWMAFVGATRSPRQEDAAEFMEAYAQLWCTSMPAGRERRQMASDAHSPGSLRSDGAAQNLRDPITGTSPMELAYGCKRGEDAMVPEETCELW